MKYQDKKRSQAHARIWEALETGQYPLARDLVYLSDLETEEVTRLTQLWPHIPVQHRRQLLHTLAEMAEQDFELEFGIFWRLGINDEDAEVRQYALEGLWEDEDARLIPHIIYRMRHDEAVTVRAAAAQLLANFAYQGELGKLRAEPFRAVREALLEACQDEGEAIEVRRRALESVSYITDERVPPLIEQAYTHPDALMRQSALFAMGRSYDKRWAAIVLRELYNPDPAMRYEAARACGELELRDAVHGLLDMLEDGDDELKEIALKALGQIGGQKAKRALKRYTKSKQIALREAATEALAEWEYLYGDDQHFFGDPENWLEAQEDVFWEPPAVEEGWFDDEEKEAWDTFMRELEALDTDEEDEDEDLDELLGDLEWDEEGGWTDAAQAEAPDADEDEDA